MKKNISYMDSVHRDGRIWNIGVMLLLLAFPVSVAIIWGASPDWKGLIVGLILAAWLVSKCCCVSCGKLLDEAQLQVKKIMTAADCIEHPHWIARNDFIKIKDKMYLFCLTEELMERVLQGPVFRCNNMIFLQNYDRMYHAGRTFGSGQQPDGQIFPIRTLFGSFGNPIKLPDSVLYAENAYTV